MTENLVKPRKKVSKSLAVTLIAGATFLLLFIYGTAGFLLFQYFRENSVQRNDQDKMQFLPTPGLKQGAIEITLPVLIQPETEIITAYIQMDAPIEKSREQIAALERSVVLIESGENRGSGVIISLGGHVITPYHVIESAPYLARAVVNTTAEEYSTYELMLLGYDAEQDLALLKFKNITHLSLQPLPLGSCAKLSEGQQIITICTCDGVAKPVRDGTISGNHQFGETDYIQINAPHKPGISGGAVLNMEGELIGLISLAVQETENIYFAISADDIKALIDDNVHWVKP
ncbi:MAG: serine protease [Bacillota bacterium]|nr:serine protease [Bacillota bacterium]MDW7677809.1 serine protease [Bacillota bacterium]